MLLQIENIHKVFADGTKALNGINLSVDRSEFVVVLGPSGSGKTTLLRILNGLIVPDSGTINFNGKVVTEKTYNYVRKQSSMIFQDFNLIERLHCLNNVLTGLLDSSNKFKSLFYLFTDSQKLEALDCIQRVGLLEKVYSRVDQLSGGQKQRVGIARAIVRNPLLLLADEPVASLDPIISKSVMKLLRDIGKEKGITIICNLHQVGLALEYSDRIIGLSGGQIVLNQKTASLNSDYIRKINQDDGEGLIYR